MSNTFNVYFSHGSDDGYLHEVDNCKSVLNVGTSVGNAKVEPLRMLVGVEVIP